MSSSVRKKSFLKSNSEFIIYKKNTTRSDLKDNIQENINHKIYVEDNSNLIEKSSVIKSKSKQINNSSYDHTDIDINTDIDTDIDTIIDTNTDTDNNKSRVFIRQSKPLSKLKTVKTSLKHVLFDDADQTKFRILFDAINRVHQIVIHLYMFLRLHILYKYHNNLIIPTITIDHIAMAIKALIQPGIGGP